MTTAREKSLRRQSFIERFLIARAPLLPAANLDYAGDQMVKSAAALFDLIEAISDYAPNK